jgi:hypothetical protein
MNQVECSECVEAIFDMKFQIDVNALDEPAGIARVLKAGKLRSALSDEPFVVRIPYPIS